jgi:membrane-associated phospholipid phosphatase
MGGRGLLLFFALCASCGAADEADWRPWLEPHAAEIAAPGFAAMPTLAELRGERVWLERWAGQAPSMAWNDVVAELVIKYQQNPLRAARAYTYVHAAIHDALVACARRGCEPALRPVAMHAAASRMLEHLYTGESRGRMEALGHSAATAVLLATGEQREAALAWQTGRAVAENAIRRALDDGWDLARLPRDRPPWKAGLWRAAPPLNMYDPAEPQAGQWRTWILKDGADVAPPPPIEYGSAAYWREVEEVRRLAAALTAEQKRIAEEWNLDLGSATPPGVWNLHARKLVLDRKLDAAAAARVFSTLNVAMMDALIACWHAKFKWWTERPVTLIRERYDPAFTPYIITPPFPSYVSGHSSVSGAAAEVLASFFPDDAPRLNAMAQEASISRLYGGIHFRTDNEAGLELGRKIGARAFARAAEAPPDQRATTTR